MQDIGRPLTFNPHLSNAISPLDVDNKTQLNYQGFINLMIITLIVSHLRLMYENYLKYGMMISSPFKMAIEFKSVIFFGSTIALMIFSILACFILESLANKINYWVFNFLHLVNFSALLVLPIFGHKWDLINPIFGIFVFMGISIVFFKLYSYVHFWNDVRKFVANNKRLTVIKNDEQSLKIQKSLYNEVIK